MPVRIDPDLSWVDAALATAARSAAVTVARAGANPPWPEELAGD